jgi:hypothetical protein
MHVRYARPPRRRPPRPPDAERRRPWLNLKGAANPRVWLAGEVDVATSKYVPLRICALLACVPRDADCAFAIALPARATVR